MATPKNFLLVQGDNQVAAPGTNFADAVLFRAYDTTGTPMPNEPVIWGTAVAEPTGVFISTGTRNFSANTDANGYAWSGGFNGGGSNLRAGSQVGTWLGAVQFVRDTTINGIWSMTNGGADPVPKTLAITNAGGARAALNSAYPQLQVEVRDQNNAVLPGVVVQASVPSGHGTFTGGVLTANATTNSLGVASFPTFTANNVTGSFTVTANVPTAPGVAAVTTAWTTVDPAIPTTVQAVSGNAQQAAVSTSFSKALKVNVTNALGNPVTGVSVTFAGPGSGASCTFPTLARLASTVAVTDSSGNATSSIPAANALTGTYFVQATVPGATAGQFQLTNGVSFQPEVCTTLAAPIAASNQGGNTNSWINVNNSFNGNSTGANVTTALAESAKVLVVAPATLASLDPIADDAKITKFMFEWDQRGTRAVGATYYVTMQVGLYDTATKRGNIAQQSPADSFTHQTATVSTFSSPTTISGAQLKAGNFGIGFSANGTSGAAGTLYVRNVKMSICYQNPNTPPATVSVPLLLCEV
jgi:hypothetical protein